MSFNPVSFLYFNPDLQVSGTALTVEHAITMSNNGLIGSRVYDETRIPKAFDAEVYISENKQAINVSGLNQVIKKAMLLDGESPEFLENIGEYFRPFTVA